MFVISLNCSFTHKPINIECDDRKILLLKIYFDGASGEIGLGIHPIVATHSESGQGSHIKYKGLASLIVVAAHLFDRIYSRDTYGDEKLRLSFSHQTKNHCGSEYPHAYRLVVLRNLLSRGGCCVISNHAHRVAKSVR